MSESPNPFMGMNAGELRQRFPGFYPPDPPKPDPLPTIPQATRPELAAQYPEFYPDGASPKVSGLPTPQTDSRAWLSQADLQQAHPEFYDPVAPNPIGGPVSDLPANWNVPDTFNPSASMPVEAPQGAPLGSAIGSNLAGAAVGGVVSGVVGVLSGESPDVAIAQGAGAFVGGAVGAAVGGAVGSLAGPGGTVVGGFIGGAFGNALGGSIGQNIGQSIHNLFFPPPPTNRGPMDPQPLPPVIPGGFPPGTVYICHFDSTGRDDQIRMRTVGGLNYSPQDPGFKPRTFLAAGTTVDGVSPGTLQGIYCDLPISCYVQPEINGQPGQRYPVPANFKQSPDPYPGVMDLPLHVTTPPMLKQDPFTSIPQSLAPPSNAPKLEPQRTPTASPTTAPSPTPTPTPTKDPNSPPDTNPFLNPNNLPGLFGMPFIPAVMPANTPSPSGTVKTDNNGSPFGGGKTPTAPANSPCSGACQRAIEGRIQGVDDKLSKLLAGNQAGQDAALAEILRRLAVLDAKVGPQAPGGLSGLMGLLQSAFDKFTDWIKLDRLLNIFTFLVTLHNAYMLSNALKQTLFSTIDGALKLFGFGLKGADGKDISLNQFVDKSLDDFAKSIFGVTTWDGIKAEWKTSNRIYQAATNILYALQGLFYSVLAAMEVMHSYVASIGNALKKWRVIGHNAFGWMNTSPNFHNSLFTNINSALMTVSQINFVIQSVEAAKSIIEQLTTQGQELEKSVVEDIPKPFEENQPAAAADKATTDGITPPNITIDNLKQTP